MFITDAAIEEAVAHEQRCLMRLRACQIDLELAIAEADRVTIAAGAWLTSELSVAAIEAYSRRSSARLDCEQARDVYRRAGEQAYKLERAMREVRMRGGREDEAA